MIKDKIRTESYKLAIEKNKELFKDKIVLDLGCGTGILSFFALEAGAKHVYAVDAADIAYFTSSIVENYNKKHFIKQEDSKITVIKGTIEEINLPVKEVDIIISEWMGYFLLFESMIDSVLFARDKYLNKTNGLIFPDRFTLNMCSFYDYNYVKNKVNFWDNVYGIDMSVIKNWVYSEPLISNCYSNNINSSVCKIYDIDMYKYKKNCNVVNNTYDISFSSYYELLLLRKDKLNGLVFWFDVYFEKNVNKVCFSTSPFNKPTHWKQCLFYIPKEIKANINDKVYGSIAVCKSKENFRELDIKISIYYLSKNNNLLSERCNYKNTNNNNDNNNDDNNKIVFYYKLK